MQKTLVTEEGGGGRKRRGVRGRVVQNKTEDMKEYVEQAMALVKQYVPPDPQKIQTAKDAGRTTLSVHDNATRIRLEIPDYLKAGDPSGAGFFLCSTKRGAEIVAHRTVP